tara:strand:- start:949 stop:1434 length:486 start_codon:yes stop_codon:yes gene_type:complete
MFTLFTTIVSFLTAGVPKVLDFFQDKGDKKHELEMAQLQLTRELELQKAGFVQQAKIEEIKLDEIQTTTASAEQQALYTHDIEIGKGASQWAVNARSLVRPIVTYILLLLLVFIEVAGFIYATQTGVPFPVAIDKLWDKDMEVVWASVLSFWFGSRAFAKN